MKHAGFVNCCYSSSLSKVRVCNIFNQTVQAKSHRLMARLGAKSICTKSISHACYCKSYLSAGSDFSTHSHTKSSPDVIVGIFAGTLMHPTRGLVWMSLADCNPTPNFIRLLNLSYVQGQIQKRKEERKDNICYITFVSLLRKSPSFLELLKIMLWRVMM